MKLNFDLNNEQRNSLWEHLIAKLEAWYGNTSSFRVTPNLSTEEILHYIHQQPIGIPVEAEKALDFVIEGLQKYAVHTPNPMYYGLYHPQANFPSIG